MRPRDLRGRIALQCLQIELQCALDLSVEREHLASVRGAGGALAQMLLELRIHGVRLGPDRQMCVGAIHGASSPGSQSASGVMP